MSTSLPECHVDMIYTFFFTSVIFKLHLLNDMCIDETTSWITLGIGTIVNTACIFTTLRCNLGMYTVMLIIAWWYGLLMQFPEAMTWRYDSPLWAWVAYMLNVTQPIAWYFIVLITFYIYDIPFKIIHSVIVAAATISVLSYSILVIVHTNSCIMDMTFETCNHLVLYWWNSCLSGAPLSLYIISMYLCIFMLPFEWMILTFILFSVSLIVSHLLYPCSFGSMWCWFICCCGLITTVVSFVFSKRINDSPMITL